jgi:hypothetical protein
MIRFIRRSPMGWPHVDGGRTANCIVVSAMAA